MLFQLMNKCAVCRFTFILKAFGNNYHAVFAPATEGLSCLICYSYFLCSKSQLAA